MKYGTKKIVRYWERARDNVIAITKRTDFDLKKHSALLNFLISKRDKLELEMLDATTSDELKI